MKRNIIEGGSTVEIMGAMRKKLDLCLRGNGALEEGTGRHIRHLINEHFVNLHCKFQKRIVNNKRFPNSYPCQAEIV